MVSHALDKSLLVQNLFWFRHIHVCQYKEQKTKTRLLRVLVYCRVVTTVNLGAATADSFWQAASGLHHFQLQSHVPPATRAE